MTSSATRRLIILLMLSLAVHGIIIALWPTIETTQLPKPGGHTITVSLLVQADKQAAQQDKPAHKKSDGKVLKTRPVQEKPERQPLPGPERNTPPATHVARVEPLLGKPPHADPQTPALSIDKKTGPVAATTDSTTRKSQRLEKVLRKAFNAHFYYPRLAIRRGWQGEVRLTIHIEANGNLSKISLLQGSGYGLLDKAAMKSLKKIEVLPEAIALLNGHSLDLILPVKYQLL